MRTKHVKKRRLLASVLSVFLLVNTTGSLTMADTGSDQKLQEGGVIEFFEKLSPEIVQQTVVPGTDVTDLNLPSTVKAEVVWRSGEGGNSHASDSNAEPYATDSNVRQKVIRKLLDVEVDWKAEPAYDPQKEGIYVFTAVPADFSVKHGVNPPQITVDVSLKAGFKLRKASDSLGLIPGETYWFDLSAEQIPGTPNKGDNAGGTMVPDKTFHYVPFTYVGAIAAYSRDSQGVSEENNVTPEDKTLFLSDYNIVRDVSWDMLNDKGFIFGNRQDYMSGGISYKLRSPSVGSYPYASPYTCDPASNEWDTIYTENSEYIRNTFHYYTIGQDTYKETAHNQIVVRGGNQPYLSTVAGKADTASSVDPSNLGFRPVLELKDSSSLVTDGGYRVVTLDLKNGYIKNGPDLYKILQIAVASGQSFEAPSGTGFQAPDSGKEFVWWEDEDGNSYNPGEMVPDIVEVLNAKYREVAKYDTVYVNGIDGDDTKSGQSESEAFRSLDQAYGMVADGGTIIVCGSTSIPSVSETSVYIPYVAPSRDVTITSNNNSTLHFRRSMILNGETRFENLSIDTSSVQGLFANGFKLVMGEGVNITPKASMHTFVLVGGEVFNNDSERMIAPAGRGSDLQILAGSYGQWAIVSGPSVSRHSAGGSFVDAGGLPIPFDQPVDAGGDLHVLVGGDTLEIRDLYGGVYADENGAKKVTWHNSLIEIDAPNVRISNVMAGSRAQMQFNNHTDGTEIRQAKDSATVIALKAGTVNNIAGGSEVLEWTGESASFYENTSRLVLDGGRLEDSVIAGGITCSVSAEEGGGSTLDTLNEMIVETAEPLDQKLLLASGMFADVGLGDTSSQQKLSTNRLEVILKGAGEIGVPDMDQAHSNGVTPAAIRILTVDGTASAAEPKSVPDNFNALRMREGGRIILTADSEFEFLESEGSQGVLILKQDVSGTLPDIVLKNKVTTENPVLLKVNDNNGYSAVLAEGTAMVSFLSEDGPEPEWFLLDSSNGDFALKKEGKKLILAKKAQVISNRNLQGITIPERGMAPAAAVKDAQYTGTVTWIPDDSAFKPGVAYTAVITLIPVEGYTLAGLPENAFTVNGALSVTNAAGSGSIRAVFPAVDCQVTFEANNGTAPVIETVPAGAVVLKPEDPVNGGFTFGGWYTDAAFENAYDFQMNVTADMTLYAKWIRNQEDDNTSSDSDSILSGIWLKDSIGWWYQYHNHTYPAGKFAWLPYKNQMDWFFLMKEVIWLPVGLHSKAKFIT